MSSAAHSCRRRCRAVVANRAGFTLLEILVSTLVGSFLLAGFLSMATFQVSATRDQSSQVELQQAVRNVAEMFTREVRRAGANPTCSANVRAIEYASPWMLYMNSDLNGNGLIEFTTESVIYQYDPTSLIFRRIANGQMETLLENVIWAESRIRYFNQNGVEMIPGDFSSLSLAQRNQIRRVQFSMTVQQQTMNGETVRAQVSSDINLRNRFFIRAAGC